MASQFTRAPHGGAAITLDKVEISVLRSLTVQLLELIGPGEQPGGSEDPLYALFTEGPSRPPADPVLARLFPDAYGAPGAPADEQQRLAAAEFRRFTENDLRARKREDGLALVRSLNDLSPGDTGEVLLTLGPDESQCWLRALNDLRLALAVRLEIDDEEDGQGLYALPDSDPRKPMVLAYLWLGSLQESLLETLIP